eukprot:4018419-Prorocentrum_lima.AAC.1
MREINLPAKLGESSVSFVSSICVSEALPLFGGDPASSAFIFTAEVQDNLPKQKPEGQTYTTLDSW